ncbi:hypothetical protein BKA70DRAFT_1433274 [Coprinopsis sp. MPI-PUGE-AT-0042]|nr:hypothetical protein BKA70DRAFT_1433274 [Coprinopsis sp. MPI-PUGE-AT-0042]
MESCTAEDFSSCYSPAPTLLPQDSIHASAWDSWHLDQPQHITIGISLEFPTPIQDLPHEVLAHIFWIALPSILNAPAHDALTMLRLVCKRWNATALATPSLWHGIYLHYRDVLSLSRVKPLKFTSDLEGTPGVWFQRGGDKAPCSMHIGCFCFTTPSHKEALAKFLASPRRNWMELSIPINNELISNLKDRLRNGGWNSLQGLELEQTLVLFYDIPSIPSVESLHLVDFTLEGEHLPETVHGWYQRFAEYSTHNIHTLDLADSRMLPFHVAALL